LQLRDLKTGAPCRAPKILEDRRFQLKSCGLPVAAAARLPRRAEQRPRHLVGPLPFSATANHPLVRRSNGAMRDGSAARAWQAPQLDAGPTDDGASP
jgi:hypothetical protein